jgi:methyltransferase (TIGR00027 family)
MMVAYMRALADAGVTHVRDFHDPTAKIFLSPKWRRRLSTTARRASGGGKGFPVAFARATADMMALRTSVIDAAVRGALAGGITQVVILGAGMDGRAWRMPELAGAEVFEVDHPATQAVKRERISALPSAVGEPRWVAVDFERDSLSDALARAGYERTRPTCWIWEGVVMYLTRTAMRATLAEIARNSAVGSVLVLNYHTERRRGLEGLLLRAIGEPIRSAWSPAEMAAELRAVGFEPSEDSGVVDWANRFASGPVRVKTGRVMRVVVATSARETVG